MRPGALGVAAWKDRLYPTSRSRDARFRFRELLDPFVTPEARVLEIGAGTGVAPGHALRGRVREIVGVDLDERVLSNPAVDEAVVADACSMPFEDASFDLAIALSVLEHVQRPHHFAREVARVLRPGGALLALTPNRRHYVALAARMTPLPVHRAVNASRGRAHEDTFATSYLLNSPRDLERALAPAGLAIERLERLETSPNYLDQALPFFLAGAAWERAVNRFEALAGFRAVLLLVARRT